MFGYARKDWRPLWDGWVYVDTVSDHNPQRAPLREQSPQTAAGPVGVAGYDIGRMLGEAIVRTDHLTRAGVVEGLERVKRLPASSGHEGTTMGFGAVGSRRARRVRTSCCASGATASRSSSHDRCRRAVSRGSGRATIGTQLRDCLREDVVRNGPFRDEYRGRNDYVAFLAELMPTLPGYSMDVARVTYADDGRLAFAELAETVTVDGSPLRTEESLVFELDGARRDRGDRHLHQDRAVTERSEGMAAERTPVSRTPMGSGGAASGET